MKLLRIAAMIAPVAGMAGIGGFGGIGGTAGTARADDDVFPVQGDVLIGFATGSQALTSHVYFSLSYMRTIVPLTADGKWRLIGGVGISEDLTTYWKRDDREAPDAITALHAPGLEMRVGVQRGTRVGSPRFVLKMTPQWANGADMKLPTDDRGFGLRTSIGVAYPAWLLGRVEPDAPGTREEDQTEPFRLIGAALIPSEIEYVFQVIPGDTRHGFAIGWSF